MRAGMRMPGWGNAMWTHLNLAFGAGRQRPGNVLTDLEPRRIAAPVLLIWGDHDVYGDARIAARALELMPRARLEIIRGGHAPFLDDPERCAELIEGAWLAS
jgi:pimeloyl-ACP methyl ester carboxylesterase